MKKPRGRAEGQIRIIGGQWRGRKLPVPDSDGLRPTTDRVRETLFNWLMPVMAGARCLDCFAGSGALGLEALSRYASQATLLELQRPVAQQLEKNCQALGTRDAAVINTDALNWLSQRGEAYDVVFIDPPFRKGLLQQMLPLLEDHGWLSAEAMVYIESEIESGPPPVPVNWHLYREKIAGQVAYRLYQRQPMHLGTEHDD
ncbi:16S rRNA (guanine(966)-N(2))-methyltransferase RsmD [Erwinia sp. OLTSP20]|uniref:16S rRNA (guanine(966)-N(2))-methyltransferase n=1 Tax=unclassified Erwinia TaxID=2622719 RepID=UPI000C17ECC3|nr:MULTISPECIES: 16S rRNA (guanine(966)-N(2))-methyltransferase [unclassified Erwinia]PIJ51150.1 16S rRNA (guanine(966)-N(2))-methyltransferase RsmD [Erwinia sp. OAMSP11]PIJ73902.1 16S rRNA (guanine(966)-N(2))-methyltransferase RsmD [Erwinia sp. OLSSP12]PIJ83910.1 16S rRNA (guanine(966)-N(2))-methyltransferase RsmD [Erwinia sp. OLCASP19]PIJ86440.1 16S rRNA (guanine(966)-N(2))-methyltransferase RsmD [Erwinia sp. OLMTSP26]PIJ87919.1 16S rRNA (guanine(966)-N(2))-methyltransferase RsmD [Erwinia sp